ncbi:MAG: thiamine-phosphate kinase, partial [Candidatus Helarchaeales archaeon]
MKINEAGEIGIIKIFRRHFLENPVDVTNVEIGIQTRTGLHEDCAVIALDGGKNLVVTTDLLGSRTHKPRGMTMVQFGRKAVTVNLSDLAAMGAHPSCLVMSVGFPPSLDLDVVEEVARGMAESCRFYGVPIVGGDVNLTDDVILSGTAIGTCDSSRLLTRHGAREGDVIAVTGTIGDAALGLKIILEDLLSPEEIPEHLKSRTFEPVARIRVSQALARSLLPTSCADITDGLGWELHKIAMASGVGIKIWEEKIPRS